jgi:hypothetical protein
MLRLQHENEGRRIGGVGAMPKLKAAALVTMPTDKFECLRHPAHQPSPRATSRSDGQQLCRSNSSSSSEYAQGNSAVLEFGNQRSALPMKLKSSIGCGIDQRRRIHPYARQAAKLVT